MSNIPVFLASDNNYAPFVATTIASICDNTSSFIDFYILDGGITKENQEKICKLKIKFNNFSIEFLEIDSTKIFRDFTTAPSITLSTYNRFLIPQLKPNLEKVLYSDVDVIVMGDIKEMYDEDLNGYILGAIWEEYAENNENIIRKNNLNLPQNHKYFSAGNLLIDCKKWREENMTEKLLDVAVNKKDILTYADQDAMNIVFCNNYKSLAKKYCYLMQDFRFYDTHEILIRHYNGVIKPWRLHPSTKNTVMQNVADFWYYMEMTSFYEETLSKTLDIKEQDLLKRRLRLESIINKANTKRSENV